MKNKILFFNIFEKEFLPNRILMIKNSLSL